MDVSGLVDSLRQPELRVPRRGPLRFLWPHKVYRGRLLSHLEWLPFEKRFQELTEKEKQGDDVSELLHEVFGDYCDAVGIPSKVVFGLPTRAVVAVMSDFLDRQTESIAPPAKSTSGSSSQQRGDGVRLVNTEASTA